MRRIVDGVMYDTEKAELLASYEAKELPSDFRWYREDLYQTKNGRFFLHGRGGPLSPYASVGYGCSSSGEKIVPLSEGEVVKWLENTENYDVLLELFPDEIEEA